MDLLEKYPLKCLKEVWYGGEVFPTKYLNYWRRPPAGRPVRALLRADGGLLHLHL